LQLSTSSTDYLNLAASNDWVYPADFTIECYFNRQTMATSSLFGNAPSGSNYFALNASAAGFDFYANGTTSSPQATFAAAMVANTWYHFAMVRSSGVIKVYLNGTQVGSNYSNSSTLGYNLQFGWGCVPPGGAGMLVCFDDCRISKGIARYTANFIPPISFADDGYTVLHIVANTGFIDSRGAFVATSGTPPTINTSIKKFGSGAIYFPGNNAGIEVSATNSDWLLSGGSWTIDFWSYLVSQPSNGVVLAGVMRTSESWNFSTGHAWVLYYDPAYGVSLEWNDGANGGPWYGIVMGTPISAGAWYHQAITYDGTNLRLFLNGVLYGTNACSFANISSAVSTPLTIGKYKWANGTTSGVGAFNGYLDEFRFSKGIARWTSSFTPPTVPSV
jgi:hypothetical protein